MKIKLDKVPKLLEEFVIKKLPDGLLGIEIVKPKRKITKLWIPIVLGSAVALTCSIAQICGKTKVEIETFQDDNINKKTCPHPSHDEGEDANE
ncbi:MAG: hypothetical protein K0Q56_2721 [Sporolactobacillus laevolacticus]|jgi:hypothetical protein|nr:hypothetical protein [Sporolactobacillus laevolacticus]